MRRALPVLLPLALICAAILAGCGGSDDPAAGNGAVAFTIQWPESSRLIPLTAQSIRIVLILEESSSEECRQAFAGPMVAEQLVPRPPEGQETTVVLFSDLHPAHMWATATAYPNSDGTGTPVATGYTFVHIEAGQTTSATLTMQSTNEPPLIQGLTADPQDVGPAGSSAVTCDASDPDGDSLTYQWSASGGTTTGAGSAITWTAPDSTGSYTITCTANDGHGGTASETVTVYVSAAAVVIE